MAVAVAIEAIGLPVAEGADVARLEGVRMAQTRSSTLTTKPLSPPLLDICGYRSELVSTNANALIRRFLTLNSIFPVPYFLISLSSCDPLLLCCAMMVDIDIKLSAFTFSLLEYAGHDLPRQTR